MKSMYQRVIGMILVTAYFLYCAATPTQWHFIDFSNLIFHEAGHTIFIFFGMFIRILMGSGFQVLLPLIISGYFFYQKQQLSCAVTLMWAGQSTINVSVYAKDALAEQLPLLGGDGVIHDWNYLLSATHLLAYTPVVGETIYVLGVLLIFVGIVYAYLTVSTEFDTTENSVG